MTISALRSGNLPNRPAPNVATLRRRLSALAAAAIIPLSIFATSIVLWSLYQGRTAAQRGTAQAARALAFVMDEQIVTWQTALNALSTSPALDTGDYQRFRTQAEEVARQVGGWLVLSLPSGQQVVNTSRSNDAQLPYSDPATLPSSVTAAGQTHVSNLFVGPVTKRLVIAVTVPVIRDGRVTHALHLGVFPEEVADHLAQQELPRGWIAALMDGERKIIARVPEARMIGRPAPDWYVASTAAEPSVALLKGRTPDGQQMHGTHRDLAKAPWSLMLAAPDPEFALTWKRPLAILACAGIVLVIGTCAAFIAIGRQLAAPINGLAAAARAAMRGEPLKQVSASNISEINQLRSAVMALSHRQILLREANHRIKNGLQLVSSSLGLHARQSRHDERKEHYRAAQSHIDAIARLHERLYQTDQYEFVDAFTLVRDICSHVAAVGVQRATLQVNIEGGAILSAEIAGPFVLIVAELATNAVKHASDQGSIEVRCRMEAGSSASITISNDGPGLPPDFDLTAQAGLGLRMCVALAEQIHGDLRAVSSTERATFQLRVPALYPRGGPVPLA